MSKKPRKPREASRSPGAANVLGWRRLPGSAANYRNISDHRYPIGATISNRKMSDLNREARLGETTTKEQYTRGVKQGRFRYDAATEGAASIAQSGFYSIRKREEVPGDRPTLLKIASRGFSPNKNATEIAQDFADDVDQDLFVNVPEYWREGRDTFSFDDQTYMGLGASIVSPKTWEYIGYWKSFHREMNLNTMSEKRRVPDRSKGRKGRADKLLDLEVRPYLGRLMISESAPSVPDWMVLPGVRRAKEREWDDENVYAGIEF